MMHSILWHSLKHYLCYFYVLSLQFEVWLVMFITACSGRLLFFVVVCLLTYCMSSHVLVCTMHLLQIKCIAFTSCDRVYENLITLYWDVWNT